MAWTTTSNVSAGSVLTATTFNNQVLGNLNELRGDWAQARRTSGDFSLNNTSWTNLDTGLDLTLAADAGDVIEVGISSQGDTQAVALALDVVTIVSGSVTNSFATGGAEAANGQGIISWRCNSGVETNVGGPFWYKTVAGDISSGNVLLRLRYRTLAGTAKTLRAQTNLPFVFTARNIGPVEV